MAYPASCWRSDNQLAAGIRVAKCVAARLSGIAVSSYWKKSYYPRKGSRESWPGSRKRLFSKFSDVNASAKDGRFGKPEKKKNIALNPMEDSAMAMVA
jgi:hypothetical protein